MDISDNVTVVTVLCLLLLVPVSNPTVWHVWPMLDLAQKNKEIAVENNKYSNVHGCFYEISWKFNAPSASRRPKERGGLRNDRVPPDVVFPSLRIGEGAEKTTMQIVSMKLIVSSIRKTFPHSITLNSLTLYLLINLLIVGVCKQPIKLRHSLFQPIRWLLSNFKSLLLSSAVSCRTVTPVTHLHPPPPISSNLQQNHYHLIWILNHQQCLDPGGDSCPAFSSTPF